MAGDGDDVEVHLQRDQQPALGRVREHVAEQVGRVAAVDLGVAVVGDLRRELGEPELPGDVLELHDALPSSGRHVRAERARGAPHDDVFGERGARGRAAHAAVFAGQGRGLGVQLRRACGWRPPCRRRGGCRGAAGTGRARSWLRPSPAAAPPRRPSARRHVGVLAEQRRAEAAAVADVGLDGGTPRARRPRSPRARRHVGDAGHHEQVVGAGRLRPRRRRAARRVPRAARRGSTASRTAAA